MVKKTSKKRQSQIEASMSEVEEYLRNSGANNISSRRDYLGYEWDRGQLRATIQFFPYVSPNRLCNDEDAMIAIIRFYSGIQCEGAYDSLVCEFIEEKITPFVKKEHAVGHLQLDFDTGDILYEAKLVVGDEPFSCESLKLVESAAQEVIHKWLTQLNAVAHGHLPRLNDEVDGVKDKDEELLIDKAVLGVMLEIRSFCILYPGHPHYQESTDDRDGLPIWRLETGTYHGTYLVTISFTRNGLLILSVHRGRLHLPVQTAYRADAALEFQRLSEKSAAVVFNLGAEDYPPTATVVASMYDDPDVGALLHRMEWIALDEVDLMETKWVRGKQEPRGSRQPSFPKLRNFLDLHEGKSEDEGDGEDFGSDELKRALFSDMMAELSSQE